MSDSDMQVRLVWKDDRSRSSQRGLGVAEWCFLLVGLAAIDMFVWVNTSTVLYQAYEDWSFDQTMRGVKPSTRGFMADEISAFFGNRSKMENPELPRKPDALPAERPPLPEMLLGRLRIPRLHVAAMVREGADSGTLRTGIGHIPGTALPGRAGNVGLAGHRDTFFRALRNIEKDDTIDFETRSEHCARPLGTYQARRCREGRAMSASPGIGTRSSARCATSRKMTRSTSKPTAERIDTRCSQLKL